MEQTSSTTVQKQSKKQQPQNILLLTIFVDQNLGGIYVPSMKWNVIQGKALQTWCQLGGKKLDLFGNLSFVVETEISVLGLKLTNCYQTALEVN